MYHLASPNRQFFFNETYLLKSLYAASCREGTLPRTHTYTYPCARAHHNKHLDVHIERRSHVAYTRRHPPRTTTHSTLSLPYPLLLSSNAARARFLSRRPLGTDPGLWSLLGAKSPLGDPVALARKTRKTMTLGEKTSWRQVRSLYCAVPVPCGPYTVRSLMGNMNVSI